MTDPKLEDPSDNPETTIVLSDEELAETGWMVDTKNLEKRGWEERYLEALSKTGNRVEAADHAGVSVRTIQRRCQMDAVFATLHEEAMARTKAKLQDTMIDHAINGVPETYKNKHGVEITRRAHDSRLLVEVAKMLLPELRPQEARGVLDGGVHVTLQIGDTPPVPKQLPAADVEVVPEEIPDTGPDGT